MTAVVEAPVTQQTSHDRQVHWCCLIQDDMPLIGLCGELPIGQKRVGGRRVNCPRCLPLIVEHVATCKTCWLYAASYLR